jgi:hypothetical protein
MMLWLVTLPAECWTVWIQVILVLPTGRLTNSSLFIVRLPLWTSGHSSWLQIEVVLGFLWGKNWIYILTETL